MLFTMKWIRLFIVVISLGYFEGAGQNLHQTFDFALDQFRQGNSITAEKAFKRVLFFDKENQYRSDCLEKLAVIASEKGDHLTTLNYLDQSYFLSSDPLQQANLQFARVRIFIETQEYQKALTELYQIDLEIAPEKLALYEGYCHYQLKDFVAAETAFGTLTDTPEKTAALEINFAQAMKIEESNPRAYQIFSYVVPGLGQILLGDAKSSLNSLLLNGALVMLFFDTARKISVFDATLSVLPWFYRYYTGGVKVTKDLAIARKEKKHKENLLKIIHDLGLSTNN